MRKFQNCLQWKETGTTSGDSRIFPISYTSYKVLFPQGCQDNEHCDWICIQTKERKEDIGHLLAEGKLRFTVFQAVMDSSVLVADGDDYPLQTAVGVVTEQPDGAQETNLVTYFGEDLCSGDQKQKFYSVQVVRNEDSGVVNEILCDNTPAWLSPTCTGRGPWRSSKIAVEKGRVTAQQVEVNG